MCSLRIHYPENRKNQSDFKCLSCGHASNAFHNVVLVVRKKAMDIILNSEMELAGTQKNMLRLRANLNRSKTVKFQDLDANKDLLKGKRPNLDFQKLGALAACSSNHLYKGGANSDGNVHTKNLLRKHKPLVET